MPSGPITIDLLASLLLHTLLSPYLALLPLLAILLLPHQLLPRPLSIYCILATTLRLLHRLDARLAAGPPRKFLWIPRGAADPAGQAGGEVVVITGAAGGVGRRVARTFAARGVPVAGLDVRLPEGVDEGVRDGDGVTWWRCDVASRREVGRIRDRIVEEMGTPTVLINNAAVVVGKPLLELTEEDVSRSVSVNLIGPINTIQAFLPGMLARSAGGTLVTVSSVLGFLGCARLSDYTATKSALTALHRSLRAELALLPHTHAIRTVLLHPGQIATPLFAGVVPPSTFLGPVLPAAEAARRIVEAVDAGTHVDVGWPLYARWIAWLAVLPPGVRGLVRWGTGMDGAAWTGFEGGG